jgi:hypothetical protein
MKTFKSFLLDQISEVAKPKAKGEKDFFDAHKVDVTDPEDQKNHSAKVATKEKSGKRPADNTKLDETAAASTIGGLKSGEKNVKQGSSVQSVPHSSKDPASTIGGRKGSEGKIKQGSSDENTPDTAKGNAVSTIGGVKGGGDKGTIKQGSSDEDTPDDGGLGSREKEGKIKQGSSGEKTPDTGSGDAIKTIGGHRNREATAMNQGSSKVKIPEETDFTKKQTKMAHAIGKHFAKKKVGDADKGGPYAVATAMVRDKPDSAQKAYNTIKAKSKNEEHQVVLTALYDQLSEDNKTFFIVKLGEDYDSLIKFAMSVEVSDDN